MFENNKKFLFIAGGAFVVFVIIVVLLFTIGSGGKKKTEETTLTFWNLSDEKSTYDKIIDKFQETHPTIKIVYVKKDPKEYLNDALREIAAGRGPDILAMPNDWLPKYHDNLIAMPDGKMANKKAKKNDVEVYQDSFVKVAAQDNIINNKIYGLPLSIDTLNLYYNPSLFNQSLQEYRNQHGGNIDPSIEASFSRGPQNWDDFTSLTKILTKRSGSNISDSAIALGTDSNVNQSVDILTALMLQNGAKMTNDDHTNAQFHTDNVQFGDISYPGTKALEFYSSFANPKSENYTWNDSMGDSLHAFAQGKSAMMIDYQSEESTLLSINPNLNFKKISLPQVAETPQIVNYASYLTYTVTRASKNSGTAWDFVLFLTNQENSSLYASVNDKTSARSTNLPKDSQALTAVSWYKPDPQKADEAFKNMIKEVNSDQNPQTAIEGAASEITTLLQKLLP